MPEVGDRAPSWQLESLAGERVRFPAISADRPIIVLFWATWCPYCKALMPRLASLKKEFAGYDLEVYAIDIAEQGDPIPEIGARDLPLITLLNGDVVAERYGVEMLPALFLVRDGRVLYRLDYPPPGHPSQQVEAPAAQAPLLAPWWEARLREVLREHLSPGDPAA
ncbi:MAG TPA: TlpA disulfide reductase family protein [Gammaproteobacteria bacterium]|nr:TlpA disulfide reductase family protein [Gammaproteobacteria bacterium]